MFFIRIARRLVEAMLVCLAVSVPTFALVFVVPADPVGIVAGPKASPETRQRIRHELGLDRPLWVQYYRYVGRVLQGDLGRSLVTRQPVSAMLRERASATCLLAFVAWVLALVIGVLMSFLAALRPRLQPLLLAASSVALAVPAFWFGLLLLYVFAFLLPLFPLGGLSLRGVVLPATALAVGMAAAYYRVLDSNLQEVLSQPFVQTALAKGLPPWRVITVHALRNAVLPLWALVTLDLASLLGGVTLTETVFHWPGLGRLAVEAVFNQDVPVLMGVVLVATVTLVVLNAAAEIVYWLLDPRFRGA